MMIVVLAGALVAVSTLSALSKFVVSVRGKHLWFVEASFETAHDGSTGIITVACDDHAVVVDTRQVQQSCVNVFVVSVRSIFISPILLYSDFPISPLLLRRCRGWFMNDAPHRNDRIRGRIWALRTAGQSYASPQEVLRHRTLATGTPSSFH